MTTTATRVVLSYPADLSEWGQETVEGEPFRTYLCRARDSAAVGDRWAEFVGVGCCGSTLDVPLRVEGVEGGKAVAETTTVEFTVRKACDLDSGWRVQSQSVADA